jgi:uncharacterized damage-inducible protein DinB
MSDSLADRYRYWFEYEKDSHAKVVASLRAVPSESHQLAAFRKAVDLLAHIAAARRLWLYRMRVTERGPAELFPTNPSLDEVVEAIDAIQVEWERYLERLDGRELARTFEYRSYEGPRFRNRVEDILTQLFGHSWYHRGQIATLIRSLGHEPAVTDLVFWTREPLGSPEGGA